MKRALLTTLLALSLTETSASARQFPPIQSPASSTVTLPGRTTNEPPAAPLPYLFAALYTMAALVIVCMPTRKA